MPNVDIDLSSSLIVDRLYRSNEKEDPAHVLSFDEIVQLVQFSPYLWSHDLILIAFSSKIVIGHLSFQEEIRDQFEPLKYETVEKFPCYDRVHAAAWSSEATIKEIPKKLVFAIATSRFEIIVYDSNVVDTYNQKIINVHKNYVNSICFDPLNEYFVSGSDDLTCRIFTIKADFKETDKYYFESAVAAVQFHQSENSKLLVGERYGTITMISLKRKCAIYSLKSQGSSLVSLDWAPSNNHYIAALFASGNVIIWFLESLGNPCYDKVVHGEGGFFLKFFPTNEHNIITMGSPDFTLKVLVKQLQHKTIATMRNAVGFSLHQHLPYVCVGVKKNIYMWRLDNY